MYSKKAAGILSKDPTLEKIIQKIPPGTLYKADSSVPLYNYLIRSIVGQQLSTKVAQVIFDRFLDIYGRKMPSAQVLKNTDDELLRSCGLSGQKSSYIKNIASFWIENKLHKTEFSELEDEEIISLLTQIKGVGQWTVQMVLMFCLGRQDVFSPEDFGIISAMQDVYKLDLQGTKLKKKCIEISQRWKPHRTLACFYLWAYKDQKKS